MFGVQSTRKIATDLKNNNALIVYSLVKNNNALIVYSLVIGYPQSMFSRVQQLKVWNVFVLIYPSFFKLELT